MDIGKDFTDCMVMYVNSLKLLKTPSGQISGDNSIPEWKQTAVRIFSYNLAEKDEKMKEVRAKWKAVCEINKKNNPS